MGGPSGPSRCWVGVWACLALLCPSLSAEPLVQAAEPAHVPLPLLLESLRQDVLLERGPAGRASRTARHAAGDDGVPWYSPSTRAGDDTLAQEELNVTSVYKRDPFKYGAGVGKWHSISAGSTTYLVGLGSKHFTLITANFVAPDVGTGQTFSLSEEIYRLPSSPLAATVFKHWNAVTKTMDVILVLSTENEGSLIWYRINSHVEQIRSWPVHKRVSHLKVFQIKEQMKLLMLTSCESTLELVQCEASADVFDFNLGNSLEARLSWSISLEAPAVSGEIGVVGDEVYLVLALPDAGVAKLYRYHSPLPQDAAGPSNHTAYGSFELWKDLPSHQISHAIFFHVSYKMYLAVGGANPALFRFVSPTRIEGCPKALQNLGFVSAWLVLPIQTYRDEVILLAEVVKGSGTDHSKKVVTLTWSSAGVFNWQDYPCFVSGHLSAFRGASCILAESSELGLGEAVALQLGDASVVSVLVPQGSLHSTLFDFQTQLQPNPNPLLSEILILKEAQAKLTEELTRQRQEWEATERLLRDTLNPSGHNVIKADWVIQEIQPEEFLNVETSRTERLQPTEDLSKLKSLMTELEALTKSLSLSLSDAAVPENGEVHLSGHHQLLGGLDVQGPSSFDSLTVSWLNRESVPTLLKDTVRIDQLEKGTISGTKTLSTLEVSDVMFDIVNDVQKDDLIFNVPGKTARVNGVLEVTEILQVQNDIDLPPQGTVGGVDLSEEVLIAGKEFPGIVQFDEVTVEGDLTVNVINTVDMNPHNLKSIVNGSQILKTFDMLDVGGQLNVEWINGFLWSNIAERIVWRDQPAVITELTKIDGVLTADSMKIEQLNGLNFPDDYVLKNANKSQLITASKKFNDKLIVGTVDFAKTIDGVPVNALVTKTTDQYLNGELKLAEADIIGDIKVDGAVNGIRLNRQKSPPLGPNVVVSSNVQFTNLTVDGTIQIINTLNEQIFKDVVQDILVVPPTSHGQVVLDGKKTLLGSLKFDNVMVSSGLVNGRKIADIARVDYPQTFHGGKTIQKAVFNNLQVTGLVDGVDVVELNAEAVRLTGVQDTLSHLTFTESSKIFAAELTVSEQLGNTPVSDTILPTSEDMCGPSSTNLTCYIKGPVITDVMRVAGNVIGDKICGWNLIDFENRRMSQSRPQTILGGYTFGDVTVTKHINVSYINGVLVNALARETAPPPPPVYEDLAKLLIDGGFTIDELVIEGHIETLAGVNTFNLTRIAEKAIKLNGSNTISGSLSFEDIVTVSSLDVTGPVNGHNLAFEIEDAVIKNLGPVTFSGRKTFAEGFIVDENIQTSRLNGLAPSSILTKTTPAIIHGTLKVNGNVYAGNINLTGLLNNIPVTNFQNRYKLVAENRHLLIGNAHFEKGVSVDDLSVMQSVKKINLEDFFKSVVYQAEPARISGFKVFVNQVVFENVNVRGRVNNLTLGEMAKDIVLHNDDNPVTINGRIRFEDSLTVTNGVSISKNLQAMELDSCLVKEWLDNAIYLSQSTQVFGLKQFKSVGSNSDLKVSVLNAVDLSKVITLNTPQDIPADLNIIAAAVERDLNVARTVNGKILQTEYDNTLMTGGNQRVTGSKSFLKGFTVQNNVLTRSLISERNISNSVTLNDDETVNGPLQFSNMVIDQDLRVTGLVSNLDVQKWNERALLKKSPLPQVVTAFYDVQGKIKCMEAVGGNGLLGGESVSELVDSAYKRRELTRKTQDDIKVEWSQLCHDTDALLDKARAQPFLFRQLEVVQSLVSSQSIASMHAFEALDQQFLAVSYSNNCSGAMYRWNRGNTAWDLVDGAVENIGSVEKWATLRNAGSTYLVTSGGNQDCPYQGGNIWRIESSFRPRNVQSMDAWQDAEIDESVGHIHLLRQSGVDQWRLADGVASKVKSWPLPETGAPSRFVPRSSGLGLSISVGENVTVLEEPGENITTRMVSRASNSYLPFGNSVTMKIADGRKLVVVTAEGSDLLVVYEDLVTANPLARVKVHGAHSLSVLELTSPGRNGQTLLAFIENEKFLRVVEYKGVEGFVDVTGAKLPFAVKEMIPVRLFARAFVNQRHFLLLRTDHQVLLLEVEMSGDPLDEPALNCSLP